MAKRHHRCYARRACDHGCLADHHQPPRARAGSPDPRSAGLASELVEEGAVGDKLRSSAAALLRATWGEDWWPDAYAGPHPPDFRVVVCDAEELVAHVSAFAIPTRPSTSLVGFGDLVVATSRRRRGLAATICQRAVEGALHRGAEILLVDTVAAAVTFARMGFEPVSPGSVFFFEEGRRRAQEHWLVRTSRPLPPELELLHNGDF